MAFLAAFVEDFLIDPLQFENDLELLRETEAELPLSGNFWSSSLKKKVQIHRK